MAGLGWGGPAAIGAQAAIGHAGRIFALIGDGGWGYSLGEVETAVRCDLPVCYVILNNGALAWVLHDRTGGNDLSTRFADADYAAAAHAFGATSRRVGPEDDLEAALATLLRAGGTSLLDVRSSVNLTPLLGLSAM
jgi:acetolactate synthase-1/2/3 large subunit